MLEDWHGPNNMKKMNRKYDKKKLLFSTKIEKYMGRELLLSRNCAISE